MTLHWVYSLLWFMAPAACANASASLLRGLPFLSTPIDFRKTWRGKPIFGNHKTWRGIVLASIMGFGVFWLQQQLSRADFFHQLELFPYRNTSVFLGMTMGLGAILGDLLKSFFKRRIGITPGSTWFPFDQIDWIVGFLVVSFLYISLSVSVVIGELVLGFLIHLISKVFGFMLHVDDVKF